MGNYKKLKRDFFEQDTHMVANDLLGKLLVRRWRNKNIVGRIVEVESYVGVSDKACHAAKGKTKRNEVMFGPSGLAYVYLVYGMHHCINVVTEEEEFPAAVLIRALEPIENISGATDGPGKLTKALRITRTQNGINLVTSNKLFIAESKKLITHQDIVATTRIGVDYAGKDAKLPWRYYLKASEFVSQP